MKARYRVLLLLGMTLLALMVSLSLVSARDVKTAKQFDKALKDKNVKEIVIKKNMKIPCLYTGSNKTIIAKGRTITCGSNAIRNKATKLNYESVKNVTINGGVWKSSSKKSLFQFVHGQNIVFKNATITCGVKGHAIELIACKNVKIENCNVKSVGKPSKSANDEQIQTDIATPKTAPTVKSRYGKKYTNGQICKNITVNNCTVTGARGVCTNFAKSESKFRNRFHENITVKNSNLVGLSSEALALFNAMNVSVAKNKIITKSSRTGTAYSIGCHVHIFGKNSGVISKNRNVTIQGNTVFGGRQAVQIYSSAKGKFARGLIKNNKLYCKKGASKALKVGGVLKVSKIKNKLSKW